MIYSCTYDPADDKLRLSASSRLDPETYARVKSAGFGWAPKQQVFYAVWSPSREDLALELAGEIGDEDTTLVERAETRAERFEDYSDSRKEDADRAHAAVHRIADGIPFGQPILVGHHSEKHARKDAERIENGMRKAVKMWETSQYWKSRAAGAIAAAKYKELPAVRARRIKTIEAAIRSEIASYTPHANQPHILQTRWNDNGPDAQPVPHAWCGPKGRGGRWVPVEALPHIEASAQRWLQHLNNRLEYEQAMLAEGGGLKADGFDIQVGGRVCRRGAWFVVTGLNKRDEQILSVSVLGHWCGTIQIEDVKDYRAPEAGDAEKVKAVTKLPPLCNYPGEGFRHMTKEGLKKTYSLWIHRFPATETHAAYRSYSTFKGGGRLDCHDRLGVFMTDQKRKDPPALKKPAPVKFAPVLDAPAERPVYRIAEPKSEAAPFEAMKESIRAGVRVVSAPQLFPTPSELARKMVNAAGGCCLAGARVLEPSAGTGNLVRAIANAATGFDCVRVVAVEQNHSMVTVLEQYRTAALYATERNFDILQADFLECKETDIGKFDAVIMNPPFALGQDVKHIQHAITFLKPGGRLVAICANGPTRQEKLKPLVEQYGGTWEILPPETFKEAGTGVNTVMLSFTYRPEIQP